MPHAYLVVLEVITALIGICVIAVLVRYRMRQRVKVDVPRTVSVDDMRIEPHPAYPVPDLGELVEFINAVKAVARLNADFLDARDRGEDVDGRHPYFAKGMDKLRSRLKAQVRAQPAFAYYAVFSGALTGDDAYHLVKMYCEDKLTEELNPPVLIELHAQLRDRSGELPERLRHHLGWKYKVHGW